MSDTKAPCGMNSAVFIRLIANLFRHHPDDHVISLGDWKDIPGGRAPFFCPTARVTVGDFRRWTEEAGLEFVVGGPV